MAWLSNVKFFRDTSTTDPLKAYHKFELMSNSKARKPPKKTAADQPKPLPQGILNSLDDKVVNSGVPWIIKDLLAEGEQMLIFGAPKVGKSQFVLQLAMSVALGEPFLKWEIVKPSRVLYLNFEMGNRTFMLRIARHFSLIKEEKSKRQSLEAGKESICDGPLWHQLGDEAPLEEDLLKEINETIEKQFFFCSELKHLHGDHVSKPADSESNKEGSNAKSDVKADAKIDAKAAAKIDAKAAQENLVRHWQSIIQEIKPELVIFDTLSKTHSINESDNSEIQEVLLQIRKICTIQESAPDGGQTKTPDGKVSKNIAHVIVHHARKASGDAYGGKKRMDLDSIRGGSAIRAEADLICGIFSNNNKQTATHAATNRSISIEARNIAPDEQNLNFEIFAFVPPRRLTPEEEQAKDETLARLIKEAFIQRKMRGLKIETLLAFVMHGIETAGLKEKFTINSLNAKLKSLAESSNSEFEVRVKAGNEKETVKYPYERDVGKVLYWIKDGSPWLNEEELKTAIQNHKPYPVREAKAKKSDQGVVNNNSNSNSDSLIIEKNAVVTTPPGKSPPI